MVLAGLGGLGFVLVGIAVNVVYVRARLPMPMSGKSLEEVTDEFAAVGPALRRPSVVVPATWVCLTVFAGGLLSVLGPADAWALVGFAGVVMQNVTFACVAALRFGVASAAAHDRRSVAGLWGLGNVLFGFNQAFLALALLGFTVAGVSAGLVPGWQAVLGHVSAVLLFLAASASPYNAEGANRFAVVGLVGWFGWITWIVTYSVTLLRL